MAVNLNSFSGQVNQTFSVELNENFTSLEDKILSQSRRVISDSIFYEQKYNTLGVSDFSSHGSFSGSTKDLNDYKFDVSDETPVTNVKTVWCENNKDVSEFYLLGTDSSGVAYFVRCDVDRSAGTVIFTTELEVSPFDLPSASGNVEQWRAWKSANNDYIIARIYVDEQSQSCDFNYAVSSYDSDGNTITNTTLTIDTVSSNDDQDDFDFRDFGSDTTAGHGSVGSHEGGAYETDHYNDSLPGDENTLDAYSVSYDDSSQSFSYNQTQLDDGSEDDRSAQNYGRYQRGDTSVSYSEYSLEEDFERVQLHATTVDLTSGNISDNVVADGGFDDFASVNSRPRNQDFQFFEALEDSQDRRSDYVLMQGGSSIFGDSFFQEEGPDTVYTETFFTEKGYFINDKIREDGGSSEKQFKFYADRDGSTTTENLTPQYSLRTQKYWFDDGSDRYGFNVNGTTVELDFAAKTGIEFSLSRNVENNEAFFVAPALPYSFSASYVYDTPTVLVGGEEHLKTFDTSISSINCTFVYDGGVLNSNTPLIGSFTQGDYT